LPVPVVARASYADGEPTSRHCNTHVALLLVKCATVPVKERSTRANAEKTKGGHSHRDPKEAEQEQSRWERGTQCHTWPARGWACGCDTNHEVCFKLDPARLPLHEIHGFKQTFDGFE
jgi:hypothetical protein